MEKICFYNVVHVGDTFFSEPFVRNFCGNNPDHTFYFWLLCGSFLYNDIKNIKLLDNSRISNMYKKKLSSGEPPEDNIEYDQDLKKMFISNHDSPFFKFKYNDDVFIAINTWCIALRCETDMIPSQLNVGFYNVIQYINQSQRIQYVNNMVIPKNIIPKLPYVGDVKDFDGWATTNSKKICFFYNYKPRSFFYPVDYNKVVRDLAVSQKGYIFIVPRYEPSLANIPNIKFCDNDFGCIETPDCRNLVMIEKITRSCDIIVTLPTGSSWFFFNENVIAQTNKKYILSGPTFEKKINDWFSYSSSSNKKIINNIEENNIKNIFY